MVLADILVLEQRSAGIHGTVSESVAASPEFAVTMVERV
jgi:hypothetical protein